MATITTYATLVTAVTEYLARDQDTTLIARIPTFIQLFEAKMNRSLFVRQMEARSTTTIDTTSTEPEMISLPSDFQSMRRVRLSSVSGKPHLDFKSGTQLDEYRSSSATPRASRNSSRSSGLKSNLPDAGQQLHHRNGLSAERAGARDQRP
jgi:hypothetical protein